MDGCLRVGKTKQHKAYQTRHHEHKRQSVNMKVFFSIHISFVSQPSVYMLYAHFFNIIFYIINSTSYLIFNLKKIKKNFYFLPNKINKQIFYLNFSIPALAFLPPCQQPHQFLCRMRLSIPIVRQLTISAQFSHFDFLIRSTQ